MGPRRTVVVVGVLNELMMRSWFSSAAASTEQTRRKLARSSAPSRSIAGRALRDNRARAELSNPPRPPTRERRAGPAAPPLAGALDRYL